jgi:hypothetical protein
MYGITILDLLLLFVGYPVALVTLGIICDRFNDPNRW